MHKIVAYVDGACSGNPGPMGAGALLLLRNQNRIKQISVSLGKGTNNIAELQAVSLALSTIFQRARTTTQVTVRTDSQYCIGVLSKGWKISKNPDLIKTIKELISQFNRVNFEFVRAHNGDKYNQWADNLARRAVRGKTVNRDGCV